MKTKRATKRTTKRATEQPEIYCDSVAGLKYHDFQFTKLKPGDKLRLVWEPSNPFDANAIRVDTLAGQKLGYIKRMLTAKLHEYRRADIKLTAIVNSINKNNPSWDCVIIKVTAARPLTTSKPELDLTDEQDLWEAYDPNA